MSESRRRIWILIIVSVGLFMTVLDNLVVTVALPSIHASLGSSIQDLEWTVNAYTLSFAVLLLTGAALGDRFGRRRMFMVGIAVFTLASAGAALAPSTGLLVAARAVQGMGAAIATPLTLTLLADAFPGNQRGIAIGVWSGISGLGVALGPLVGGAVIQLASWHFIFWINVPIGLVLVPLASRVLKESHGADQPLDLPGLGLGSAGLFGLVYGLVRSQTIGWGATEVLVALAAGVALVIAFVIRERRTAAPMLPMEFFASRGFSVTNAISLSMYFGMFGSVFFLSQYLQDALGNSALQAGVKMLAWTGTTLLVAPLAGVFSERLGSRLFMAAGLALQAIALLWLNVELSTHLSYLAMVGPFVLGGAGMALVFAPSANAVLASVRPNQAGQASGANNTIRELGGVLGVAVLASVFTSHGGYGSPAAFVSGLHPTLWIAIAVLAAGALLPIVLPFDSSTAARLGAAADEAQEPDGRATSVGSEGRPESRAPIGPGVSVA
jgi:EmrB/QacA subfamily drug resistance transporter